MPAEDQRVTRETIIADARRIDPESYDWSYVDSVDELTLAINLIYGHGFADAQAGSTEYGLHGARVDRFVTWTDDRGFQRTDEYETIEAADAALDAEDDSQRSEEDQ